MSLTSRLPEIAAALPVRVDAVIGAGAERVSQGGKERVHVDSGDLQAAIHVEREGPAEYAVVAGNDDVFYGHLEEHGTSHSAPHPFLVPSLEAEQKSIVADVAAVIGSL